MAAAKKKKKSHPKVVMTFENLARLKEREQREREQRVKPVENPRVEIHEIPGAVASSEGWGKWELRHPFRPETLRFNTWEAAQEYVGCLGFLPDDIDWWEDPYLAKMRETPPTMVHIATHRGTGDISHRTCGERADDWIFEYQRHFDIGRITVEKASTITCRICGKPLTGKGSR